MCVVSAVTDYFQQRLPYTSDYWTFDTITQFKQILAKLEELDKKLDQPDCVDPKKELYIKELELKLAQLELAEAKRKIAEYESAKIVKDAYLPQLLVETSSADSADV